MSKYKNVKTEANGIKFDSKKEAKRYLELVALQAAGKIRNLKLQPQFTLIEGFKDAKTGEQYRALKYVADFSYEEFDEKLTYTPDFSYEDIKDLWNGWYSVVEDVKGRKTKEYEIKKKLMRERFGIRIRET